MDRMEDTFGTNNNFFEANYNTLKDTYSNDMKGIHVDVSYDNGPAPKLDQYPDDSEESEKQFALDQKGHEGVQQMFNPRVSFRALALSILDGTINSKGYVEFPNLPSPISDYVFEYKHTEEDMEPGKNIDYMEFRMVGNVGKIQAQADKDEINSAKKRQKEEENQAIQKVKEAARQAIQRVKEDAKRKAKEETEARKALKAQEKESKAIQKEAEKAAKLQKKYSDLEEKKKAALVAVQKKYNSLLENAYRLGNDADINEVTQKMLEEMNKVESDFKDMKRALQEKKQKGSDPSSMDTQTSIIVLDEDEVEYVE